MKKSSVYGFATCQLILGILLLLLGIFTLIHIDTTLTAFVYVYGIASILFGIIEIAMFISLSSRSDWSPASALIMGILNIVMGILLLSDVWVGMLAMSFLFPFWMIFMCITRLCNLSVVRRLAGNGAFWFSLIVNVLGMLAGFVLLFFPGVSMITLSYLIAFYLLLAAIELIWYSVDSFQFGKRLSV